MLAASIARQHGWKSQDYRDVLRTLKKERIPEDKLLEVYRAAWPMVWIAVLGMVIMSFVPQIVTWLPSAGH